MALDNRLPDRVAVVGAGPAGCLLSVFLARRGYSVDLYEAQIDQRVALDGAKRSINLTLTRRGISALEEVGLAATALAASVPLRGRMVHRQNGESAFQAYGARPGELLYAVRRSELTATLLDAAVKEPGVQVRFETRCVRIDRESREVFLEDQATGRQYSVAADHIVGADGAFSVVRRHLQRGLGSDFRQESLAWGYKEFAVAAEDLPEELPSGLLHVWPRGERLLLAIPNADGSFLCMCALPFDGPDSFASLTETGPAREFLARTFGRSVAEIPGITGQFLGNPLATFSTIRAAPWHYRGHVLLIGDACHTVYPFYGQGLNSALEDCSLWAARLDAHGQDWEAAAADFEARRKPGTDALVELSARNFVELRSTADSRRLHARRRTDLALARLLPSIWIPLYTMVSHSTKPYDAAVRRARRQRRIARCLGIDLVVLLVAGGYALRDVHLLRKRGRDSVLRRSQ